MKKQKSMGNKGFSLVELIIVIAIMAILVGVIGSQAIPYLEKARVSKDLSAIDTAYSAFQTAVVSNGLTTSITGKKISDMKADADTTVKLVGAEVETLLGTSVAGKAESGTLFTSKTAKDKPILFTFDQASGKITVTAEGSTIVTVSN